MSENLLYGSRALTDEEEALRADLTEWCQMRFTEGARPIPMLAALMIVADMTKSANEYFVLSRSDQGWKGQFPSEYSNLKVDP